jgi:hypothetical protein
MADENRIPEGDDVIEDDLTGETEPEDYTPAPAGRYLARIVDVQTGQTAAGDRRWALRFKFAAAVTPDGRITTEDKAKAWTGRGCWDGLVFSDSARKRRVLIFRRLGIDTAPGRIRVTREGLLGRYAILDVEVEEFEREGKKSRSNKVTFSGYESAPPAAVEKLREKGLEPALITHEPESGQRAGGKVPF